MQSGKQNFVQQVGTLWVVVRWRQEAAQAGILKPVQLPVFGGVPVALSDAKIWGPPYTKSTEAETQRLIYLHTHTIIQHPIMITNANHRELKYLYGAPTSRKIPRLPS